MKWVSLVQSTPPASEPTSLAELKAYLNYEDDDQDSLITSLGAAARDYGEGRTRRAFITQSWQGHFEHKPCGGEIWLPFPKVQSVDSVKYYDDSDVLQTLATSKYHVVGGNCGKIVVIDWPSAHDTRPDRYQVNWTSGYGAAGSDLPQDLIVAIKMLVAFFFENRSPDSHGNKNAEIPMPIQLLFDRYKVPLTR